MTVCRELPQPLDLQLWTCHKVVPEWNLDTRIVRKICPHLDLSSPKMRTQPLASSFSVALEPIGMRDHDSASKSERKTPLVEREFPDRPFDIELWQEQGDETIFGATLDRVEREVNLLAAPGRGRCTSRTPRTSSRISAIGISRKVRESDGKSSTTTQ